MIIFAINAFAFIHRCFARSLIMRLRADEALFFISTCVDYVIVSMKIKTMLNSTIIDKKLARDVCVFIQ
jgi:hypothetical protein